MNSAATLVDVATKSDPTALAATTCTTFPPYSRNRNESTIWTERMLSQLRPAAGDAERFMKGM
jgi:hypothetical protein